MTNYGMFFGYIYNVMTKQTENKISRIFETAQGAFTVLLVGGSNGAGHQVAARSPLFGGFRVTMSQKPIPTRMVFFARIRTAATVMNVTASGLIAKLMHITGMAPVEISPVSPMEMRVRETMKRSNAKWMHYAIVAILSASMVYAQGTPRLDLKMAEQKVNLTASELNDASNISYQPGDTLRYMITASNIGDGLMTEPEVVDPIPMGVTYIANTAMGDETSITFSIDQGRAYMAWPPTYTVRNAQGELIEREASADMITHIKWNILKDLNPGDKSNLEFLVEVSR